MAEHIDNRLFITLEHLLESRQHCQRLPRGRGPAKASRQLGQQFTRLRGRGVDFDQVRTYQPGDDIRSIDWRVTARTGKVHTKVFNEERERPVFILCEQSSRLFFGSQTCFKSVIAAEACSMIAWTALANNDRVGGMVFGSACHEVRPQRSRQAILRLFNLLLAANHALSPALQSISDSQAEPLNMALHHSREILRPGSILYVICDHSAIEHLNQSLLVPLAAHNDLVLLPLFDPLEAALPAHHQLAFVQGQDYLSINTASRELRQVYASQFDTLQLGWQKLSRRLNCSLFTLDTRQSAVHQLRHVLGRHRQAGQP
ncbi:MAG: DUF58 domain-containing protein [Gammaproteobacteria bacterium HGW-Gammaproteobacteria-6]|nr:MAG: DUF58 domain-containing protein [Gammaproteobacteria bacterium HGW-Gammaproteobacteria-6]